MAKVIISLTMSLDGFIAGPDPAEEMFATAGASLTGRGRLFEHLRDDSIDLEFVDAITTPEATHLRYRVPRGRSPR
jgi:hypothetical protein